MLQKLDPTSCELRSRQANVQSERVMLQSSNVMPCVESVRQNWRVLSYSPADAQMLMRQYWGLARLLALRQARSPQTIEKAWPWFSKKSSTWQNGCRLTTGVAIRRLSQWSLGPGRRNPSVRTCDDMAYAAGGAPSGLIPRLAWRACSCSLACSR